MKIKTIKEQLIEMGFKHGDRINIKDSNVNPHKIDLEHQRVIDRYGLTCGLSKLRIFEFEKYTPTKEELLEELKKRSKRFEKGKQNYSILYGFESQMVIWRGTYYCLDLSGLIFTKEEVEKICDELNADREKIKILFDLEE